MMAKVLKCTFYCSCLLFFIFSQCLYMHAIVLVCCVRSFYKVFYDRTQRANSLAFHTSVMTHLLIHIDLTSTCISTRLPSFVVLHSVLWRNTANGFIYTINQYDWSILILILICICTHLPSHLILHSSFFILSLKGLFGLCFRL